MEPSWDILSESIVSTMGCLSRAWRHLWQSVWGCQTGAAEDPKIVVRIPEGGNGSAGGANGSSGFVGIYYG